MKSLWKCAGQIPLWALSSPTQAEVFQISQNLYDSMQEILEYKIPNQENLEQISNFGCWCAQIGGVYPKAQLGGAPINELDMICKSWLETRRCSDHMIGGICLNDSQMSSLGYYEFDSTTDECQPISQLNEKFTQCEFETCVVDSYFSNQILQWIGENDMAELESTYTCESNLNVASTHNSCERNAEILTQSLLWLEMHVAFCSIYLL